jgi:hypothetical protein
LVDLHHRVARKRSCPPSSSHRNKKTLFRVDAPLHSQSPDTWGWSELPCAPGCGHVAVAGSPIDPLVYAALGNARRRLLERIGLRRVQRDVTSYKDKLQWSVNAKRRRPHETAHQARPLIFFFFAAGTCNAPSSRAQECRARPPFWCRIAGCITRKRCGA